MNLLNFDKFKKEVFDFENEKNWNTKQNCIIDFYADWCQPCKILSPILEDLENKYTNISFYKVDVDKEKDLANAFIVKSLPTVIFIKKGDELPKQIIGINSKEHIIEIINTEYGKTTDTDINSSE